MNPQELEAIINRALSSQAEVQRQQQAELLAAQAAQFKSEATQFKSELAELQHEIARLSTQPDQASSTPARSKDHNLKSRKKSTLDHDIIMTPAQTSRSKSEPPPSISSLASKRKVKETPPSKGKISVAKVKSPETPPSARKRHPAQLKTDEVPKDFQRVKEALFMHIKMLWGLFQSNSVPARVNGKLLKDFNMQFSNVPQVEAAVEDQNGPDLISQDSIVTLRQGKSGCFKMQLCNKLS